MIRLINNDATPRSLTLCRIAAFGGICGAVITLAGFLAFAFVLMNGQSIGYLSLIVDLAVAAVGVVTMWVADWLGARNQPATQPFSRIKLRVVSEDPTRRSAA